MEKNEYEVMFSLEDDYWWYTALRKLVFDFVQKYGPSCSGLRLLDAGCGTGGVLAAWNKESAYGFDYSGEAVGFCLKRRLKNILRASACEVPFADFSFDAVISLDVLCNLEKGGDETALKELNRVLDSEGLLILNLPAFDMLQSTHDKAVHIEHRYTKKELRRKLEKAGFRVLHLSYRNMFLFPFIVFLRFFENIFRTSRKETRSDLYRLPPFINRLLTVPLCIENVLMRSGLRLPFGLSLFCTARRQT